MVVRIPQIVVLPAQGVFLYYCQPEAHFAMFGLVIIDVLINQEPDDTWFPTVHMTHITQS